jgi:hypothetical protein
MGRHSANFLLVKLLLPMGQLVKSGDQRKYAAPIRRKLGRLLGVKAAQDSSHSCGCGTSFIAYRLFAMTCTLQNSLSPSSLNSMPIPEFL